MSPEYRSRLRALKAALNLESVREHRLGTEDDPPWVLVPLGEPDGEWVGLFELAKGSGSSTAYVYRYKKTNKSQYWPDVRDFDSLQDLLSYLGTRS